MKSVKFFARMPEPMYNKMKEVCHNRLVKMSMNQFVLLALEAALKKEKKHDHNSEL